LKGKWVTNNLIQIDIILEVNRPDGSLLLPLTSRGLGDFFRIAKILVDKFDCVSILCYSLL